MDNTPDSTPTIELASFTVRPENEAALLAERPDMIAAFRREFPAALGAWLGKREDGTWVDVILWRSRADAEEAARRIREVPEAASWLRHIDELQGLEHLEVAHAAG
jgi:hypothetical protein